MSLPDLVTQPEIAKVLGVESRSIRNYMKLGTPIPTKRNGRTVLYPLGACVAWYVAYRLEQANEAVSELDMARQRKTLAEAELAEIKLAQERGSVVTVDVAEQTLATVCDQLRARVLAFTGRVAPLVVGVPDVAEATAIIEPVAHELLDTLATQTVVPVIQPAQPDEAAA